MVRESYGRLSNSNGQRKTVSVHGPLNSLAIEIQQCKSAPASVLDALGPDYKGIHYRVKQESSMTGPLRLHSPKKTNVVYQSNSFNPTPNPVPKNTLYNPR